MDCAEQINLVCDAGNINITKLHAIFDQLRGATTEAFERRGIYIHRIAGLVLIGRHVRVSRRLYDLAAIDFPMIATSWVTRVGNSSFDVQMNLTHADGGELLAECATRGITVDIQSRRTYPIPENIRQQMISMTTPGSLSFPSFSPPTEVPPNAFSCSMQVRYDDTDFMQHVASHNYIAFIRECASQACTAGCFTRLKGDFAFYVAESVVTLITGQTFAGEEMMMSTWEDASDSLLLYFIARRHEKTVFFAQMRLFDVIDKPASKL